MRRKTSITMSCSCSYAIFVLAYDPGMDLTSVLIESGRLRLVSTSDAYVHEILREFTDEITELMGPKTPERLEDVEAFVHEARTKMAHGEELQVAILLAASGEFIGHAGVHAIKTPLPELGIWIKKTAQGSKYGREAVTLLVKWTFENLAVDCVSYPVDRKNVPSRKIPESLGGVIEREYLWTNQSGRVLDLLDYRICRSLFDRIRTNANTCGLTLPYSRLY
jgi:RimJ/RimL family protein N-acetyltransferase